eukprot:scaffold204674_cov44-Tisochrysis_lutea.AAC.1
MLDDYSSGSSCTSAALPLPHCHSSIALFPSSHSRLLPHHAAPFAYYAGPFLPPRALEVCLSAQCQCSTGSAAPLSLPTL